MRQIHGLGFIHRDIKPDNIYLRRDGSPVLLDFGSARQAMGEKTKTLTSLVTPGYAPFEQYYSKSDEQGAYTDIYGLGATLYRAVTGTAPIDAIERGKSMLTMSKDAIINASEIASGKYSDHFLKAIDHAIQFKAEERPQTIEEWLEDFETPGKSTYNNIQAETVTEIQDSEKAESGSIDEQKPADIKLTEKTDGDEHPPLKPEPTVESIPTPSALANETSTQEHTLDHLIPNFYGARLTTFLAVIILIGVSGYLGWQWYAEDKPVRISEQLPERIEQDHQQVERQAAVVRRQETAKVRDIEIEALLQGAERDMTANRLTSPVGNNAYDKYKKILELSSGNENAIAGIDNILKTFLSMFNDSLAKQQFDEAAAYIERIRAIHPDSTKLAEAKQQLTEATNRAAATRQQAEAEQAKLKAEQQRVAELERKRKEEQTSQNSLSMSKKVYDKISEAQELIRAKQYDQGLTALQALEREKKLTPYEKAQLYNSFAFIYFTLEKHQDAIRSYENILKQPDLPEAVSSNMK